MWGWFGRVRTSIRPKLIDTLPTSRVWAQGEIIMDTGLVFALTLSALFFGGIIWLTIYSRRQKRQADALMQREVMPAEAPAKKRVA